MTKKKHDDPKDPVSPWLRGVEGVSGVVPPGRRLSPASERRPTRWSASGVSGVTPPGKQRPGEGPASESAARLERRRALRNKEAERALEAAKSAKKKAAEPKAVPPGRPTAGFDAHPFDDVGDPTDLAKLLETFTALFETVKPGPDAKESLGELILQSRAPFEITVAFTVLSALVGKDAGLRRRYTPHLERGAKTYFNLAMRLDRRVKPPRGLAPETMDPIFYDLPASAYHVPYAFAVDAFCRIIELLRGDEACDRALVRRARDLRARFIERRSLGGKALAELFPWPIPEWAPADEGSV